MSKQNGKITFIFFTDNRMAKYYAVLTMTAFSSTNPPTMWNFWSDNTEMTSQADFKSARAAIEMSSRESPVVLLRWMQQPSKPAGEAGKERRGLTVRSAGWSHIYQLNIHISKCCWWCDSDMFSCTYSWNRMASHGAFKGVQVNKAGRSYKPCKMRS